MQQDIDRNAAEGSHDSGSSAAHACAPGTEWHSEPGIIEFELDDEDLIGLGHLRSQEADLHKSVTNTFSAQATLPLCGSRRPRATRLQIHGPLVGRSYALPPPHSPHHLRSNRVWEHRLSCGRARHPLES